MIITCYAKLNLCLYIGAPLISGRHPLISVFQSISLHDRLHVTSIPEKECRITQIGGPAIPQEENLLTKAYQALMPYLSTGIEIRLEKQIPMGGGLGGGSSNAAGLIGYFWQTGQLNLSWEKVNDIAAGLGSDVPYFLTGNRALVSGTGETITPLSEDSQKWFILLTPPIHSSTQAAYQKFDEKVQNPTPLPKLVGNSPHFEMGENDLTKPVFSHLPALAFYAAQITSQGYPEPFMTGSGATLYLVFSSEKEAQNCKKQLSQFLPENEIHLAIPTPRGYDLESVG